MTTYLSENSKNNQYLLGTGGAVVDEGVVVGCGASHSSKDGLAGPTVNAQSL